MKDKKNRNYTPEVIKKEMAFWRQFALNNPKLCLLKKDDKKPR